MATFNTVHHESGGVVLFNGELILIFCENVNLSIVEKNENETGKLYLTTHRMIFTNKSMKNNLKSISIPFYTMQNLSLEQPIFGANYIKGKAIEAGDDRKFTFKLKFTSGGATEYGQALLNASKAIRNMTQSSGFQQPPPYTNPAAQYYQAPPNIYQPAYNCGFALPTDIFNQPPPAGFIYTSEAPPPYPGLNTKDASYPSYPQSAPSQPGYSPQLYPIRNATPAGFGPPPGYPVNPIGFAIPATSGPYPPPPPAYPGQQNGFPSGNNQANITPYPAVPTTTEQNQQTIYPRLNDIPSAPPQ